MSEKNPETPTWISELDRLRKNGELTKVQKLFEDGTDIWIRRSSGTWQKGRIWEIGGGGFSVGVKWYDKEKGKELCKDTSIFKFLEWQEGNHEELPNYTI